MSGTGSVSSVGTRIACIPVHRTCKDMKPASPKKAAVVAECSPRTKRVTRSCHSDTSSSEADACGNCRQPANAFHQLEHEQPVPQTVEEAKEAWVKTPEKCRVATVQKTSSPVATDACSVALSRLVLPVLPGAVKKESPVKVNAYPIVHDSVPSTTNRTLFRVTDNDACNGDHKIDPCLLPASIVYPSCEQNVFLGNFGLANKAELPQLQNGIGNRLHRDVGGKLRRGIKPNAAMHAMFRRANSMRCVSFEDSTDMSDVELSSYSLHTSRESSPRSLHTRNMAGVSVKKLSSALSKRLKSSNVDKTKGSDLSAESSRTETSATSASGSQEEQLQSSLSILADMALADLQTTRTQTQDAKNLMPISSAKSKVRYDV